MKYRVCIAVDEDTILKVREGIRKGRFKNRSHAFEHCFNQIVEGGVDDEHV